MLGTVGVVTPNALEDIEEALPPSRYFLNSGSFLILHEFETSELKTYPSSQVLLSLTFLTISSALAVINCFSGKLKNNVAKHVTAVAHIKSFLIIRLIKHPPLSNNIYSMISYNMTFVNKTVQKNSLYFLKHA